MKHFDLRPDYSVSVEQNSAMNCFKALIRKASFAGAILLSSLLLCIGVSAQPTISSVSPIISAPGSAITINGTNFNTSPANNIVYFGATQATVNTASATSLSVTVPFGATYAPVTVNNTATALTGFSQYSFLPDYDNSAYIPGTIGFGGNVDFTDIANTSLGQVVVADIDGDGKPDLIVVGSTISVYRNISTGGTITSSSFAAPLHFGAANNYQAIAVGDIDGDGVPDLVVAGYNVSGYYPSDSIYVLRNISTVGAINFASPGAFFANSYSGFGTYGIAIMDIDGDGKADVVATEQGAFISVYQNTATPGTITTSSLAAPVNFSCGTTLNGLAAGDLDGDGKPDIAAIDAVSDVWVYRNTSTPGVINFSASVSFAADSGAGPDGIVISDIDGDGKPDLAVTGYNDSSLSIYRSTATVGTIDASSFAAPVIFTTPNYALNLAAGDFDGDGKPDIAVVCFSTNTALWGIADLSVSIYRNTAIPGTLNTSSLQPRQVQTNHSLINLTVGDLNGDGKSEIITVNNDANNISILQNDPILPPPRITSVSQMIDAPGTAITITGTGFNTSALDDIVYFGATRATVNSASVTSLNVTVPVGATYAPIAVNNSAQGLTAFSQYSFLPDFNNSAYIPGSMNFDGRVNFTDAGSSGFNRVIIQDVNGDGKPDMIVAGAVMSIYINTSTAGTINNSSFAAPFDIAIPGGGIALAAGDIDGDGKPDLAVCSINYDSIYIYRNTSSGGAASFAPAVAFLDSSYHFSTLVPAAIAIMDMDGDGKADVVTCTFGNGNIAILRNNATAGTIDAGSLEAPVEYISNGGGGSVNMVVCDLDGDGKPDIAISPTGNTGTVVFQNLSTPGAINFAPYVNFIVGTDSWDLVAVDIDGDGKPDLVTVNEDDTDITVIRNTATPGTIDASSFAAPVHFASAFANAWYPLDITTGDFDGDGKPDLAVITSGDWETGDDISQSIILFRNTSVPGTIDANSFVSETYQTGDNSVSGSNMAAGDLDGDGKADLVVVNYSPSALSVYRNDPLYPPPTITNVSPYIDSDGTLIIITGTNFNTNAVNDIVYFGAVQATVNAASATSLTVTVPAAAGYAPITVDNTLHGLTAFSPKSFLPDFNNSAYLPGTINFDPYVSFPDTSEVGIPFILLSDVDGDGKPDLIVARTHILVYRNTSTSGSITSGSFAAPFEISFSGGNIDAITTGDIDGDGKPDIAILAQGIGEDATYVFHNLSTAGSISFEPAVAFTDIVGIYPIGIAIADIDGDGKADVVIENVYGLSVLQNKATPGQIDSTSLATSISGYTTIRNFFA